MVQSIKWAVGLLGLGFMYSVQSKVDISLDQAKTEPKDYRIAINVDGVDSGILLQPFVLPDGTVNPQLGVITSTTGVQALKGGASAWVEIVSARGEVAADHYPVGKIRCTSLPDGSAECNVLDLPRVMEGTAATIARAARESARKAQDYAIQAKTEAETVKAAEAEKAQAAAKVAETAAKSAEAAAKSAEAAKTDSLAQTEAQKAEEQELIALEQLDFILNLPK